MFQKNEEIVFTVIAGGGLMLFLVSIFIFSIVHYRQRVAAGTVQVLFTYANNIQLKSDKQIVLFRIVQEAIQNAIKHANPSLIQINITSQSEKIYVAISNDGESFDERYDPGMGLTNMKHRTELLGGDISWQSSSGAGTTVSIELPEKKETV